MSQTIASIAGPHNPVHLPTSQLRVADLGLFRASQYLAVPFFHSKEALKKATIARYSGAKSDEEKTRILANYLIVSTFDKNPLFYFVIRNPILAAGIAGILVAALIAGIICTCGIAAAALGATVAWSALFFSALFGSMGGASVAARIVAFWGQISAKNFNLCFEPSNKEKTEQRLLRELGINIPPTAVAQPVADDLAQAAHAGDVHAETGEGVDADHADPASMRAL